MTNIDPADAFIHVVSLMGVELTENQRRNLEVMRKWANQPVPDVSKVIAVDFDGTLAVDGSWPECGREIPGVIDKLKGLQSRGYRLILWTCRCGESLENAVTWCAERGLIFDAVNRNLPEVIEFYGEPGVKVLAGWYLDDKSHSCPAELMDHLHHFERFGC